MQDDRQGRPGWHGLLVLLFSVLSMLLVVSVAAQVPRPAEVLGFEPGADYQLAHYEQLEDYYRQLAAASPRVLLREIGESVLGRPLLMLVVSSEENLARLERLREIGEALARARIDPATAAEYAEEGRAVVWIDAGLHATERAPSQMMPLLAHRLATDEGEEVRRIRREVITLLAPQINPDGLDIVAGWYERNLGTPWETTSPPWLYHHYVGHDINRDAFMNNMPESRAASRVLYREWFPQIVYNHHQTGPAWARIFLPPFADPVNPNIHPGVTTGVNLVGSAMASRFALERMPGVVSDMVYSMWWNGGMRTVPYFHNMIGILTETSHSTPTPRYYDREDLPAYLGSRRGASRSPTDGTDIFYPYPWQGGESHFRDAVDYTLVASLAVLDVAARLRSKWLLDIYRMGRDAIAAAAEDRFAYVFPADQWDPVETAALLDVLWQGGVEVHRARGDFEAGESVYGEGSHVVFGAQAFRPYVVDLLERQSYPERRRSPEGPPDPPYDLAGWTLPMQMGVRVDRIDQPFEVQTVELEGPIQPAPGRLTGRGKAGYLFSHRANASALLTNRLLAEGARLYWLAEPLSLGERTYEPGTVVVERAPGRPRMAELAAELGIDVVALDSAVSTERYEVRPPRVGLYKSWVANMDEGWTRWLLERYAFEVESLDDAAVRAGGLERFDAILLPDQAAMRILNGHLPGTMPEPFVGGLGLEGALELRRFVERGGTLIALDAAADFALGHFGLPLRNAVADVSPHTFFVPGSLIRTRVETGRALTFGLQEELAVSFVRSRAFEVITLPREGEGGREETELPAPPPVEVLARYAEEELLMSGWALGAEEHIGGKIAAARVRLGEGEVVVIGFRPQFRGQARASYQLLFNPLFASTVDDLPWLVEPLEIEEEEVAAPTDVD